ncbi:MAG: hypothetical protein ACI9AT_000104 [Ulvibacter sp.]|jgi:hypothetical protein
MEKKEKNTSLMTLPKSQNEVKIANHKLAAHHLRAAAKKHLDAAKHYEEEKPKKAAQNEIDARDHIVIVKNALQKDAHQYVIKGYPV